MKTLTLLRDDTGDQGTFSRGVLVNGMGANLGEWDWIELPWRNNAPDISCIPPGTYHGHMIQSPHFQRAVYVLDDVPDRSAIEIHPANFGGCVALGFYSDLRGCCAPGLYRGSLLVPGSEDVQQRAVMQSMRAFQQFMDAMDRDALTLIVSWKEGVGP